MLGRCRAAPQAGLRCADPTRGKSVVIIAAAYLGPTLVHISAESPAVPGRESLTVRSVLLTFRPTGPPPVRRAEAALDVASATVIADDEVGSRERPTGSRATRARRPRQHPPDHQRQGRSVIPRPAACKPSLGLITKVTGGAGARGEGHLNRVVQRVDGAGSPVAAVSAAVSSSGNRAVMSSSIPAAAAIRPRCARSGAASGRGASSAAGA